MNQNCYFILGNEDSLIIVASKMKKYMPCLMPHTSLLQRTLDLIQILFSPLTKLGNNILEVSMKTFVKLISAGQIGTIGSNQRI